jgi:hypothetical protein
VNDPEHCGNCGNTCPDGADENGFPLCRNAQCQVKCGDGPNGPIVPDLDGDILNCGACGHRCPDPLGGEPRCSDGECLDPCHPLQTICDNQCTYASSAQADNCVGEDACCPVVAEGQYPVPALAPFRGHAVRIRLAERRRLQARLSFDNGSCPGYTLTSLPRSLISRDFIFSVKATNLVGNAHRLAQAVKPKGDDTACALIDVDLDAGVYRIQLEGTGNTSPGTVTWSTSAPAPLVNVPASVERSGSYGVQVQPGNQGAVVNVQLAQASRLRMRYRERLSDFPELMPQGRETCTGSILLAHATQPESPFDTTTCGEVDRPLPAGAYRVRLTHTLPEASEGRLEVGITPIPVAVREAPARGTVVLRQPPAVGQVDAINFGSLGGEQTFTVSGDGCHETAVTIFNTDGGFIAGKVPFDDCDAPVARYLAIGPHTLWIHHGELRAQRPISVAMNGLVETEFLRAGTRDMPGLAQNQEASLFIDMPADGRILVEIKTLDNTCTGNADLWLYNDRNQQLIYDDDSGVGLCPRILHQVVAGRYRVRVRGNGGIGIAAYTLHLSFQ